MHEPDQTFRDLLEFVVAARREGMVEGELLLKLRACGLKMEEAEVLLKMASRYEVLLPSAEGTTGRPGIVLAEEAAKVREMPQGEALTEYVTGLVDQGASESDIEFILRKGGVSKEAATPLMEMAKTRERREVETDSGGNEALMFLFGLALCLGTWGLASVLAAVLQELLPPVIGGVLNTLIGKVVPLGIESLLTVIAKETGSNGFFAGSLLGCVITWAWVVFEALSL